MSRKPRLMSSVDQTTRYLERRRAPRFVCQVDLEMEWGSALLRGRICDLSASGAFIESSDPLWVGAGFRARIVLDDPLHVDCFVRRVEPGRGMGVTLTVPQPEFKQRFQEFLNRLSQTGLAGGK